MKHLKSFLESTSSDYYEQIEQDWQLQPDDLETIEDRDKNFFTQHAQKLGLLVDYYEQETTDPEWGWDNEAEEDVEMSLWVPENILISFKNGRSIQIHKAKDGFFYASDPQNDENWRCDGRRGVVALITDLDAADAD